jgi:hypothetical protein
MNDDPKISKQEWAKLFADKAWQAFMWHVDFSVAETMVVLKLGDGIELHRAQGAISALERIKAFQEGVLQTLEEEDHDD